MQIAVASGKGGTGKTTLATNLAVVAAQLGRTVAYVDCDVEEPNGHLFLKPQIERREPVTVLVPQVVPDACDGCGACAQACQYGALVCLGDKPLVFPELCHGCGGCALACPRHAIVEVPREIGRIELGHAGRVQFIHGLLNVGEAKSPPVIRAVRAAAPDDGWQIIDAPPGTSCPVVTTLRDCDLVLLVTEPTPFGLHDLQLAVATVRQLALPMSVVINRADLGDRRVERFCAAESIAVLLHIPDDRRIAEAYSRGELIVAVVSQMRSALMELWQRLEDEVAEGPAGQEAVHRVGVAGHASA
jgi:MinD superfamily P-loop ATPase